MRLVLGGELDILTAVQFSARVDDDRAARARRL